MIYVLERYGIGTEVIQDLYTSLCIYMKVRQGSQLGNMGDMAHIVEKYSA